MDLKNLAETKVKIGTRWAAVAITAILVILYWIGFDTLIRIVGFVAIVGGIALAGLFVYANVQQKER
jgi:hypothetical protein